MQVGNTRYVGPLICATQHCTMHNGAPIWHHVWDFAQWRFLEMNILPVLSWAMVIHVISSMYECMGLLAVIACTACCGWMGMVGHHMKFSITPEAWFNQYASYNWATEKLITCTAIGRFRCPPVYFRSGFPIWHGIFLHNVKSKNTANSKVSC